MPKLIFIEDRLTDNLKTDLKEVIEKAGLIPIILDKGDEDQAIRLLKEEDTVGIISDKRGITKYRDIIAAACITKKIGVLWTTKSEFQTDDGYQTSLLPQKIWGYFGDKFADIEDILRLFKGQKVQTNKWVSGRISISEFLQQVESEEHLNSFLLLKHRIARCFLSIGLDLQEIITRWNEDKEEGRQYLAAVLWGDKGRFSKVSSYYIGKLEESRSISDMIWKIVQEQNLQNNEWWKYIKDLLGSDNRTNSPVYPLFKSLDDLLNEGRNKTQCEQFTLLDDSRIRLLIEYFGDLQKCWNAQEERHIEWHLDEYLGKLVGKANKYSFNDWFTAIDVALDRLRVALPSSNKG